MLRATLIALFTFICPSFSQELPKFPKTMPGVVNIPHLPQQPTKTVKPVYPPEALQRWIQATIVLDAVLDTQGAVETLGCDTICSDARPDLLRSAAEAVRQWQWSPVLVKGKPVRVRTRVAVEFALDANSPSISVCNVFRDPQWFMGKVVNLSGTVARVAGVNVLTSKDCDGSMVITDGDASPPDRDAKYAALQQALAMGSARASLRGLIRKDSGPGQLAGQRLVLQRVLQCSP
jgi:TonB family protein